MIVSPSEKLQYITEYYFSRKLREVAGMIAAGKPVLNLGIGNPDQAPSDATIQALIDSASEPRNHGYQSYKGIPALRKAMASWYADTYGVDIDPETEILPLLGSKEGISHISHAFLDPGDIALVPDPGYPTYASATRLAGGVPVSYPLEETKGWAPDFSGISEEVLYKAKLMWVNYPNMPTGAKGSHEVLREVLAQARKYRILVVNDNPYSLVLNEGRPMSLLQVEGATEVAMELNSLSKSHNMAGWRVGILLGSKEYIDTVLKVKSNVDSGMFLPVQEAAVAALHNTEAWHMARNAEYASRRSLALDILSVLGCTCEEGQVGMFLWARIPDRYADVEALTEKVLQEAHVFLTPGFIFGEKGRRYIRISLCSSKDDLMEALRRIKLLSL